MLCTQDISCTLANIHWERERDREEERDIVNTKMENRNTENRILWFGRFYFTNPHYEENISQTSLVKKVSLRDWKKLHKVTTIKLVYKQEEHNLDSNICIDF